MPCSVAYIRFFEPIWQRLRNGKTWDAYHWKHLRLPCRPSFNDIQWDNQGSLTDSPGILSRRFSAYFSAGWSPALLSQLSEAPVRSPPQGPPHHPILRWLEAGAMMRAMGVPTKWTEGTAFQHVSTCFNRDFSEYPFNLNHKSFC